MKRVFVIWTHSLFHDSIRLILRHPSIEIVGTESDYTAGQERISQLSPDLVIVEETEFEGHTNAETMSILQKIPHVIRLSLSDNEMSVFDRRSSIVADASDLLQTILGETK